jgi:hypothetical protein
MRREWVAVVLVLVLGRQPLNAQEKLPNGLYGHDTFPLAVWMQSPANATKYREIGINTYVGLWRGPSAEQLDALEAAGLRVICGQSERSLRFKDRPVIVGWLQDDEPDNAQSLGQGQGYGPPLPAATIVERYEGMKRADPDRPVLLNLGQGVAWDGWYGRGVRTNHPEDYVEYLKGCDIASFDIYPASHDREEIAGKLWYVPLGVDRLREWTDNRKPVWCCIETTRINNPTRKPTPREVHSEVWMAIIHGARGLIYFAHQFEPEFIEAGLLADSEMAEMVKSLNAQIQELAPVLHSAQGADDLVVTNSEDSVPVDMLAKRHVGATYVFAVAMRPGSTETTFTLPGLGRARVEVLGEGRTLDARDGAWSDSFGDYAVHLYRVVP